MGRIRTVKPELFTHEELFDLELDSGLPIRFAFAGLFTCCDKAGRFKWKPRTLKLAVLPHDEIDFSRVLDALSTRGFIVKYALDGVEYGFIPTWDKHQVLNNRETESDLPEPDESLYISTTSTRDARVDDATGTPVKGKGRERKGKEGEGKEITVEQKSLDHASNPEQKPIDQARTIFAYWQKVMDSPKSVMDNKRKGLLLNALKHYSPADICKAIRGCSKSPHNMGQNDRSTKYNGLGLILRDAEHIDRFIGLDAGTARAGAETIEQTNARVMAELLGGVAPAGDIIEMETA
jgi:hypothetical protein